MSEGTNEVNPELAKKYINLHRQRMEELLERQMEYMSACREIREQDKREFKMGVAEGLPKEAFKFELKRDDIDRKYERRLANLADEVEQDTIELADQIREALGDFAGTELGGAAVTAAESAKPKGKRGRPRKGAVTIEGSVVSAEGGADALDSLTGDDEPDVRPAFLKNKEEQRVSEAEERLANLKSLN